MHHRRNVPTNMSNLHAADSTSRDVGIEDLEYKRVRLSRLSPANEMQKIEAHFGLP